MSETKSRVGAGNWKPIGKTSANGTTLVGTADVNLGAIVIKGVCLFKHGDKRWIGFPAREWIDRDGKKQLVDIIGFANPEAAKRIRAAVLAVIRQLAGEVSAQQPEQAGFNFAGHTTTGEAGRR